MCLIVMNIDGKSENVYYRYSPCGGVKRCAMYTNGCSYVAPTYETKACNQHPNSKFVHSAFMFGQRMVRITEGG